MELHQRASPSLCWMSGAAVAWMLLTLLLSVHAAQGPQDDEPLGKEPPGSPSMVIRLAHRLNRRGMPIATKRDLSRYYFSATNDMGVTHCMLQGVLRNASDDPKEPSAPPPYWDHENDPHMCKHLRDLAHAGENAYLHLMMRMIVDNGTAYIRGVTLVEPVGKHPVAWHFLTQSWRSETWSHKLYLGSMRTGNIYGPLTVAPAGWMQWEGKWYGGELWTRIFFEPFELLPEDAVNPELEVYSDMFGYTCFLKPSTDSPLERLVSKALNPTKLNPTARPVAKPRTVFFMTGFFLLNPEWGATMMTWHINWHKQFGVDLTVMYVFMDMIALVENPKVQALVERGKLAIVHWDVSPGLATPMFTNDTRFMCTEKTGYWNQIYIYNHFMVSMWLEDVRVIVGDVDEWLITPKPTTIWKMFDECVPEHEKADPKPVALLTLMRRAAYCKGCQNRSEVFEFMERDPTGAASQHPFNKYVLGTDDDPMKPKSIYNPALIMSVDPHLGWALEGSIRRKYDKACAYLLHVRKLFVNRPIDEGQGTPLSREELWPLYQPLVR